MLECPLMKSSGQKAGFSIAMMIGVIIAAGFGVDWWDAHHARPLPKPGEVLQGDDGAMKRLADENERLKTENALLNMQNDALRKQIEESNPKPADVPKTTVEPEIVGDRKAIED